jgi:hypothetical protein
LENKEKIIGLAFLLIDLEGLGPKPILFASQSIKLIRVLRAFKKKNRVLRALKMFVKITCN